MFRNRRTSQKPSDELYKNFKANFPHRGGQYSDQAVTDLPQPTQAATSLVDALDVAFNTRSADENHRNKDNNSGGGSNTTNHNHLTHVNNDAEPTHRGSHEAWNFGSAAFTPSVMDPNSHSFNLFASQMPGYYTPTPGGTNTLYHSQAGDLHTPGLGVGMSTPLSMPNSEGPMHVGQSTFQGFPTHLSHHLHPQSFQNLNPFQMNATTAFAPQHFTHQTSFESMEGPVGESPIDDIGIELDIQPTQHSAHSPDMLYQSNHVSHDSMKHPALHPSGDHFRYHATLNAPTAMIKSAQEIPITYLNKGQAYALHIVDTQPQSQARGRRYRTFVRVSFEDEQQRQKPAACWQLWKEGRGTNEAHQRGGRLQAVEFAEPSQPTHGDESVKPRVDLQEASFDGFCVTWTPPPGLAECTISVRFNFLSTDFSHSKGVKGIPVRLCAKTETIDEDPALASQPSNAEVCYCKVKLFRDHGAERKLSNDVAHVKKTIDKLNQQIAQIEQGLKEFGKRKRSGSLAKSSLDMRPNKLLKHRRTWSVASAGSTHARSSAEDDMHTKLQVLQEMFTSTRTTSVLCLTGDPEDDPDDHPVVLIGGEMADGTHNEPLEGIGWDHNSVAGADSESSTPSQVSLSGGRHDSSRRDSSLQQPTPSASVSRSNSNEWRGHQQNAMVDIQPTIPEDVELNTSFKRTPTRIKTGTQIGTIEAIGVDPSYEPPPVRTVKPAACFFILPSVAGKAPPDHFYRAVYLATRTIADFVVAMARKCNVEPTSVHRTYRVVNESTMVLFDDDCVRELPEGQAMSIDFCEVRSDSPRPVKQEWPSEAAAEVQCDGEGPFVRLVPSKSYELRLVY